MISPESASQFTLFGCFMFPLLFFICFRSENLQNPGLEQWTTVQAVELGAVLIVGAVVLPNLVLLVRDLTSWLHYLCAWECKFSAFVYVFAYEFHLCLLVDYGASKGKLIHKNENGMSAVFFTASVLESSMISSNLPQKPTAPRW